MTFSTRTRNRGSDQKLPAAVIGQSPGLPKSLAVTVTKTLQEELRNLLPQQQGEPSFVICDERHAKQKPAATEILKSFTKSEVIPRWDADEAEFAWWVFNVIDLEMQVSSEAACDDAASWLSDEALSEHAAALAALSTPTLIKALRTGQSLSGPQRTHIADLLENADKPKPKRKRGRPKGSGFRSYIHEAGRDVDRIKQILRRYFPKQKGIPTRALELAADFWGFNPTTIENFRKSPRRIRSPAHKRVNLRRFSAGAVPGLVGPHTKGGPAIEHRSNDHE